MATGDRPAPDEPPTGAAAAPSKPITQEAQRLAEFLGRRGASAACQVCQANSWADANLLGMVATMPIQPPNANVMGGPRIEALTLICENCGFIRFHAADVVRKGA